MREDRKKIDKLCHHSFIPVMSSHVTSSGVNNRSPHLAVAELKVGRPCKGFGPEVGGSQAGPAPSKSQSEATVDFK